MLHFCSDNTLAAANHVPGLLETDSKEAGWHSIILKRYNAQNILPYYQIPEISDQRIIIFERAGHTNSHSNCLTQLGRQQYSPIYQDGDITLIGANREKTISWSTTTPHKLIHLYLPSSVLNDAQAESKKRLSPDLLTKVVLRDRFLTEAALVLAEAIKAKFSENYANTMAQLLAIHLLESRGITLPPAEKNLFALQKVDTYIRDNLSDPLTNEELARLIGRTSFQLIRMCKLAWNEPPMHRVARLRMQKAKELLSGTRLSITEIAALCGYPNSSNFTVAFKRATGMTPNQWRTN
ncbi:AraC family transcriptional regulator [Chromatiaceae bacterium AAb-1]|nr:AraC family transcriptional regulator [Chromatiaceae bacterium AAb-1]